MSKSKNPKKKIAPKKQPATVPSGAPRGKFAFAVDAKNIVIKNIVADLFRFHAHDLYERFTTFGPGDVYKDVVALLVILEGAKAMGIGGE